jgi:hypothetical protein
VLILFIENEPENRSVGGSIPPLGTIAFPRKLKQILVLWLSFVSANEAAGLPPPLCSI